MSRPVRFSSTQSGASWVMIISGAAWTNESKNCWNSAAEGVSSAHQVVPSTLNLLSIDSYWDAVRAGVNGVIAGTGIPLIPGTNIPVAQVIDTPFTGIPRVYNPGVPANLNQSLYVGDGLGSTKQTILPEQERWSVNLNGSYELSESATLFVESKYAFSNNTSGLSKAISWHTPMACFSTIKKTVCGDAIKPNLICKN